MIARQSYCKNILDIFIYDTSNSIFKAGQDALNSVVEGEENEKYMNALQTFTQVAGVNIRDARRRIADKLIDDNLYKF